MNEIQFRMAKAKLSAVVDDAERGEPTTITRHGKPVAVVVSPEHARRIFGSQPNLLEALLAMPADLPEIERDQTPLRSVKF